MYSTGFIDDWRINLLGDVSAGFTLAFIIIPQGLAYGILASLPPQYGLYTAIAPILVYALFGSSRHLSVGPAGIIALLVAEAVKNKQEEDRISGAILLSFFVGLVSLCLAAFRAGIVTRFLSHSVLVGFTSGCAIVIMLSQASNMFGMQIPASRYPLYTIIYVLQHLDQTNRTAITMGLTSVSLLIALRIFRKRLSKETATLSIFFKVLKIIAGFSALIILGIATIIARGINQSADKTYENLAIVGAMPKGLIKFSFPDFAAQAQNFPDLFISALVIAMIGFTGNIAVGEVYAHQFGYQIDGNQELVAQGISNIIGSFFCAFPSAGSLARTAINVEANSHTLLSGFISGIIVLFSLIFLTDTFYYMPYSTLASIIVVSVSTFIDIASLKQAYAYSRPDFYIMLITFVATISFGVEMGLTVGFGVSILLVIEQAAFPPIVHLGEIRIPQTGEHVFRNIQRYPQAKRLPFIEILRIDAPIWFANCKMVSNFVMRASQSSEIPEIDPNQSGLETGESAREIKAIILDCSGIDRIDLAGIDELADLQKRLNQNDQCLILTDAKGPVRDIIKKFNKYHAEEVLTPWLHKIKLHGTGPWNFMASTPFEAITALEKVWAVPEISKSNSKE